MKKLDEAILREQARAAAEAQIRQAATGKLLADPVVPLDAARLIHELQVYQVELEMQNQELAHSRGVAEGALARYAELYDFAPVGYFTLTRNGTIHGANLTGASLLGVERARLTGTRLGIFVADEDRSTFNAVLSNAFERRFDGMCEVALAPSPQTAGGLHYLQISIAGVTDGEECRAAVVDVTARRRAEAEQRASQKMEAIGQLAGGIAHDFNNVLTVILNEAGLSLERDDISPEVRRSLTQIRKASERGGGLTRQLLSCGSQQLSRPQVVDVNEAATAMSSMLRRVLGEEIELVLGLGVDTGRIDIDPSQLDQVLLNLAVNARDAMPGGGTLTLATSNVEIDQASPVRELVEKSGLYVRMTMSDTGRGMTPETMSHLFEPFFTTKGLGQGTGLGLSTVYGIVERCGGGLSVRSTLGVGSTFEAYFPRTVAEATQPGSVTAPVEPAGSRSETILVVEDEPALRNVVQRILTSAGYHVLGAANRADAIRLSEHHSGTIHLALSDVMMAGMSAEVFGDRLRVVHPEARLLYMSGYTGKQFARDAAFIAKPFTSSALTQKIRDVLAVRGD